MYFMQLHRFVFRNVGLIILLILVCNCSCSAKKKTKNRNYAAIEQSNAVLSAAIGDSITDILINARHVEICTDSCQKELSADERSIVRYVLADKKNLSTDMKVFGEFVPYLRINFHHKRKSITILYDFNLHKWMMKGANDALLCMYDLKSNEIIRFAQFVLPQDKEFSRCQ